MLSYSIDNNIHLQWLINKSEEILFSSDIACISVFKRTENIVLKNGEQWKLNRMSKVVEKISNFSNEGIKSVEQFRYFNILLLLVEFSNL